MQADQIINRLTEEAGTGHCCQTNILNHPFAEFQIRIAFEFRHIQKFLNIYHNKVSALGYVVLNTDAVQTVQEIFAFFRIQGQQIFIIFIREVQTGYSCFLQGGCCTNGQEVMHLFAGFNNFFRTNYITQTPTGDGIGFGQGVAGNGVVIHTGQCCHAGVVVGRIYHVLINFVGNNESIIFQSQLANGQQFFLSKYFAARVGRIANDDGLSTLLEAVFNQVDVKIVLGRNQRNKDRLCTGQDGVCTIVFIEGRENHNLVPGIADGHNHAHHGFGTTAGNADFGFRVDFTIKGLALLSSNCRTQIFRTIGNGILVRTFIGNLCQRIQQRTRRVKIRETLGKINCIVFIADAGHATNYGISKSRNSVT